MPYIRAIYSICSRKTFAASLALAIVCTGCQRAPEVSQTLGYVDTPWEAPLPLWPEPHAIPVCWETSPAGVALNDATPVYKEMIRKAVSDVYAAAGINFQGWDLCQKESRGIRIFTATFSLNLTADFGNRIDGTRNGINLSHSNSCLDPKDDQQLCLQHMAIHEFGHALGLHHEMNRRDQSSCFEYEQTYGEGDPGALMVGDFDPDSIMNYCSPTTSTALSAGDIRTLTTLYQQPLAIVRKAPLRYSNELQLSFKVEPANAASSYRFKFAADSGLNCTQEEGYSLPQAFGPDLVLTLADLPDRDYRLCLIGIDAAGVSQDLGSYTSIFWTKDTVAPAPIFSKSTSEDKILFESSDPQLAYYRYKFGSSLDCSTAEGYGEDTQAYQRRQDRKGRGYRQPRPIAIPLTAIEDAARLSVCIIAQDHAGNWQTFEQAVRL